MIIMIILGIAFGIIGGMGLGGGIVLVPALTMILGFSQRQAQGAALICSLPMSACAIIIHIKNKNVYIKESLVIAAFGAVTAVLSAFLANNIDEKSLSKVFAWVLVALGVQSVIKIVTNYKKNNIKNNTK